MNIQFEVLGFKAQIRTDSKALGAYFVTMVVSLLAGVLIGLPMVGVTTTGLIG